MQPPIKPSRARAAAPLTAPFSCPLCRSGLGSKMELKALESEGIDPPTSRMLSGRSRSGPPNDSSGLQWRRPANAQTRAACLPAAALLVVPAAQKKGSSHRLHRATKSHSNKLERTGKAIHTNKGRSTASCIYRWSCKGRAGAQRRLGKAARAARRSGRRPKRGLAACYKKNNRPAAGCPAAAYSSSSSPSSSDASSSHLMNGSRSFRKTLRPLGCDPFLYQCCTASSPTKSDE